MHACLLLAQNQDDVPLDSMREADLSFAWGMIGAFGIAKNV